MAATAWLFHLLIFNDQLLFFLKQGPVASEVENVNSYSYKNLYLYLQELCIESSII